jgi:hypothetical protein
MNQPALPILITLSCLALAPRSTAREVVLTDMEIVAGKRGVALALTADDSFLAEFSSAAQDSGGKVTIRLEGVSYGLPRKTFDDFSPDSPVSSVSADTSSRISDVELQIALRVAPLEPVRRKPKDRQWLALLYDKSVSSLSWKASDHPPLPQVDSSTLADTVSDAGEDEHLVASTREVVAPPPAVPAMTDSVPEESEVNGSTNADAEKPKSDSSSKVNASPIVYKPRGRDPFLPLDEVPVDDMALPDVEKSALVGILFDNRERVALLEEKGGKGVAYALRERDPVKEGRVLKIRRESVVFILSDGGISHTFTLKLKNEVERNPETGGGMPELP